MKTKKIPTEKNTDATVTASLKMPAWLRAQARDAAKRQDEPFSRLVRRSISRELGVAL